MTEIMPGVRMVTTDRAQLEALEHLQRECYRVSREHGFHDNDTLEDALKSAGFYFANPGTNMSPDQVLLEEIVEKLAPRWREMLASQRLMLKVDEAAEAHEEIRSNRDLDEVYYVCKACGQETAALPVTWEPEFSDCCTAPDLKPEGVPIESADAVIRYMDDAEASGYSLGRAIAIKQAYNESRPFKHGRQF